DSSHTARISSRRVRPTDRDYAPAAPGGESTGWLRCVQSSFPNRGDQLMIYEGKAITVKALEGGIVELKFDLKGESVNKFNRLTLNELRDAVAAIKADASVKGVIVSSGKDVFIVGADITEFVDNFQLPDEELVAGNLEANKIFSAFEDLEVPTVAAINGIALGGGLEMCLAADYRVM